MTNGMAFARGPAGRFESLRCPVTRGHASMPWADSGSSTRPSPEPVPGAASLWRATTSVQTGSPGSATRELERRARDSQRSLGGAVPPPSTQQASCRSCRHSHVMHGDTLAAWDRTALPPARLATQTGRCWGCRQTWCHHIPRPAAAWGHSVAVFFPDARAHAHVHTLTSTSVRVRNARAHAQSSARVHTRTTGKGPWPGWGPAGAWGGRPENKAATTREGPAAGGPAPLGGRRGSPSRTLRSLERRANGGQSSAQPHSSRASEPKVPLSCPPGRWPDP